MASPMHGPLLVGVSFLSFVCGDYTVPAVGGGQVKNPFLRIMWCFTRGDWIRLPLLNKC